LEDFGIGPRVPSIPQLTATSDSEPNASRKAQKEKQRGGAAKEKFDVHRRIERAFAEMENVVVRLLEAAADGRTEHECNDASCRDAH
jgi:hypothetical protein